MPENFVLLDPGVKPLRGQRSGITKALLGDGELALIQNFWWDTGVPTVRGGTQALYSLPDALFGATLISLWTGEMNGNQYVVWAFSLGSKYEIWASENAGAIFRVSEVGSWSGATTTGDTRFTTLTGRVVFQKVPTPKYSIASVTVASYDVLLVSNGTDRAYVWNPSGTQTTTGVTAASNASPIRITTGVENHNLNDADTVTITGVLGNTAANGSYWADRQSATTFDLYYDEALTKPVVGNGTYTSAGTVLNNLRYVRHQPVTVPQDWKMFSQTLTMRDFWDVAVATGSHTYGSGGAINQARYNMAQTTAAPYNAGTNFCILCTWTTSAVADDIMHVYFPGDQLNMHRAIGFLVEGTALNIHRLFVRSKIEIGKEDVAYGSVSTWTTIYNPEGTAEAQRRLGLLGDDSTAAGPALKTVDSTNARYLFFLPTDHLAPSNRTGYHLRFTYKGSVATAGGSLTILAILGAGDLPGGATFNLSYEDRYAYMESFGIEPSFTGSLKFEQLGGPDSYTGGAREQSLPISTDILYDYILTIPNSQGAATIDGGLAGEPTVASLYFRLAEEDTARYFYSVEMYAAGASSTVRGWLKSNSGLTSFIHNSSTVTGSYLLDESDRDPFREAPGAFQIQIPPFLSSDFANSRLFIGNVYDTANAKRDRGRLYFSWLGNVFRLQDLVESVSAGVFDERSGSRDDYAGETIRSIKSCAAQAAGRSMVHVITSQSLSVQGYAGNFVGSAESASQLGIHTRISDNGTNAPDAVVQTNGKIFWPDQFGQFYRYEQGQVRNISRRAADDVMLGIPTGRVDNMAAVAYKDRYCVSYTAPSGTANSKIACFNDVFFQLGNPPENCWEATQVPPVAPEFMAIYYETTDDGIGQRWLIAPSGGVVYHFDKLGVKDIDDDISVRLTFAEFMEPVAGSSALAIEGVWLVADAQAHTLTIDRQYRQQSGLSRSTCSLASGRAWDGGKTTVVSGFADGHGERGMAVYLDVHGLMRPGSVLWHVGCDLNRVGGDEAPYGGL